MVTASFDPNAASAREKLNGVLVEEVDGEQLAEVGPALLMRTTADLSRVVTTSNRGES